MSRFNGLRLPEDLFATLCEYLLNGGRLRKLFLMLKNAILNDQIKEPMLHLHTLICLLNAQDGINEASLIKKSPPPLVYLIR